MIGRKTLSEIRAELEAALSGPGGPLSGPPAVGDAKGSEVVESLRRFLATKPQAEETRKAAENAETPAC